MDLTLEEVQRRIEGLDEDTQREMVCAMVGHSRITNYFLWRHNCARCGDEVGDNLMGIGRTDTVVVGHDCETCRENAKELTWKDTFLAPDPFATKEPT